MSVVSIRQTLFVYLLKNCRYKNTGAIVLNMHFKFLKTCCYYTSDFDIHALKNTKLRTKYSQLFLVQTKASWKLPNQNKKLTFRKLMHSYIHYFLLLDQAVHSLHPKVLIAPLENVELLKQSKICK